MKFESLDKTLAKLETLIQQGRFEELETDSLEIKPVPPTGGDWSERYKSVCAFLNTRGGFLILGVKDEGSGKDRHYDFKGWDAREEGKLKDLPRKFTDRNGRTLDLTRAFLPPVVRPFLDGQLVIIPVDELPADQKFAFFQGTAYRRLATGDHTIGEAELERQEQFKEEARHARELELIPGSSLGSFDLDKLNDYINQLNQPVRVESIKPDLESAVSFLERKAFLKSGVATVLGLLVCGAHPVDLLGFRCQVHCFVDVPQEIARDKQILADNVLPLLERSLGYVLRNIHVGVTIAQGGSARPQYPESLLRETINNALAHRDYSINQQVFIEVRPAEYLAVQNPGAFPPQLRIELDDLQLPLLRIIPEAKPRNPKLADVLSVYRKWEGRGIGMATLVNLCLQNEIDLPYYRLQQSHVKLFLCAGKLLDDSMEQLFESYERFITSKLGGASLTQPQKLVLSYLIKSHWANERNRYTILLTQDNNHSSELRRLELAGLIERHPISEPVYPVYVVSELLIRRDFSAELRAILGLRFDGLDALHRDILNVVYRYNQFSVRGEVSAKRASFYLWPERGRTDDIRRFDAFYRKVRTAFNKLEKGGILMKAAGTRGYVLNPEAGDGALKPVVP